MAQDARRAGNILGAGRAEADTEMLNKAFVQTADYRALVDTIDFNYVVGRRGTGKSALFQKVSEQFLSGNQVLLSAQRPAEHEALEMQRILESAAKDYRGARAFARLAWQVQLLTAALEMVESHYKARKTSAHDFLSRYIKDHPEIFRVTGMSRAVAVLRHTFPGAALEGSPAAIAEKYRLEELADSVREALSQVKRRVVIMFDGLEHRPV